MHRDGGYGPCDPGDNSTFIDEGLCVVGGSACLDGDTCYEERVDNEDGDYNCNSFVNYFNETDHKKTECMYMVNPNNSDLGMRGIHPYVMCSGLGGGQGMQADDLGKQSNIDCNQYSDPDNIYANNQTYANNEDYANNVDEDHANNQTYENNQAY